MRYSRKKRFCFLVLLSLVTAFAVVNGEDCETFDEKKHFGEWVDADFDGENTRIEVLIQESMTHVDGSDLKKMGPGGAWQGIFTGKVFFDPNELEVVPVVPLREVYESGGWKWNKETRSRFKNFLNNKGHLIVVQAKAAGKRQGRDVAEWLPGYKAGREVYALMWVKAKNEFRLTADPKELKVLFKILKNHHGVEFPEMAEEVECFK